MADKAFTFSSHAQLRRKQMGVTEDQVLEVLCHPEVDHSSGRYGPNARVAKLGDLAVPYDSAHRVIITILPRTTEVYVR